MLEWRYASLTPETLYQEFPRAVAKDSLAAFMGLSEASGKKIVQFTKWYGGLTTHATQEKRMEEVTPSVWYSIAYYRSSSQWWRFWARKMRGVLRVASDLHEEKTGDLLDWYEALARPDWPSAAAIGWDWNHPFFLRVKKEYGGEQSVLLTEVNFWLSKTYVVPQLRVGKELQPDLYLATEVLTGAPDVPFEARDPSSLLLGVDIEHDKKVYRALSDAGLSIGTIIPCALFSQLWLQVVTHLTSPNGLYRCDKCGTPFAPLNIKARSDRRRFCSDWCRQQGHRDVARESMQRRRQKKQS